MVTYIFSDDDIYTNLPEGKVPADYAYDPESGQMIDRTTGQPVDDNFNPIPQDR